MGLLLSILVSCVGVVELIAFYSDLRRGLRVVDPEDSDLETVTCNYKKMLTKEYREIFAEVNGNVVQKEIKTNFLLSTSPKTIFNSKESENSLNPTTLDVNSKSLAPTNESNYVHKANNSLNLVTTNVKQSSIQVDISKFECTSNHITETISANSTIIESEPDIGHKISHTELHETMESGSNIDHKVNHTPLHETNNSEIIPIDIDSYNQLLDSHEATPSIIEKIYLLEEPVVDPVHGGRSASPYPTYERLAPRGSICSELLDSPTINVSEVEEENIEMESDVQQYSNRKSRSKSRSSSKHRSRSPSPQRECRKSLSPIDKRALQIQDQRRHRSVSPCKRPLEDDQTTYLQKRRRSKSSSDLCGVLVCKPASDYQLVIGNYWKRSPSPFEQLLSENAGQLKQHVLVEDIFSDEFKNSLDGVKSKNSNEERKREFKRKRGNRNRSSQNSLDSNVDSKENLHNVDLREHLPEFGISVEEEACSSTSSSAVLLGETVTCERSITDTNAAYEESETSINTSFNNVVADTRPSGENSKQGSSKEGKKKSEPFWVN